MNGYLFVFLVGVLTAVGAETLIILAIAGISAYKDYIKGKRKGD